MKKLYQKVCNSNDISIFSQPWWLDITAGKDNWDVVVWEESGNLFGAMPYTWRTAGPFRWMKMPPLTPWLDIWLNYPDGAKYTKRLAFEKDALTQLITGIPDLPRFYQKYGYGLQNWLPFYWKGFSQTTRYSYLLDDLSDLDAVFAEFKQNTRYDIRRAAKTLEVMESEDVALFLSISKKSFDRQDKRASYSDALVKKLDLACRERECRRILFAMDREKRIHAGMYLVWDNSRVYYLMGGGDPALRNSGANSLLVWEAIRFASTVAPAFDFEGSMLWHVERFFRSFGARQQPYFSIHKSRFPWNLIELIKA